MNNKLEIVLKGRQKSYLVKEYFSCHFFFLKLLWCEATTASSSAQLLFMKFWVRLGYLEEESGEAVRG